jgi:uncharacterized protein YjbI with pentapeptide repeats
MELFNRAAGQLRDPRLEVRLAAIYTLAGIARDFPDFANPVFELVQAYLRAAEIDYDDDAPPVDVQAILNLCGPDWSRHVLKSETLPVPPKLDIHGAFVRRADFSGASLRNANISYADATNANFRDVDFAGASLRGTILRGADLSGAKNLTFDQLKESIVNEATILPDYIEREKLLDLMENHERK